MHSLYSVILLLVSFLLYSFSTHDVHSGNVSINSTHLNSSIWVGKPPKEIILDRYLKEKDLLELLENVEQKFSSIVKLIDIGTSSVDQQTIWAVRLSTEVQSPRKFLRPMFKFVANIHGDEAVGNALMVSLVQYLAYSYGHDNLTTQLLNTTDIWIVPTMNPDGFRRANESQRFSGNGNCVDLDRAFPDKFVRRWGFINPFMRQREEFDMMLFISSRPFVLSGNLQGGAIVANYSYDSSKGPAARRTLWSQHSPNPPRSEERGEPSLTPDNEVFVQLAKGYAKRNHMMASGDTCNISFPDGIVNGNYWNKKSGSMQDYNYAFSNCFELTFYLSCVKYPPAADLPIYWHANLESMLNFMESTRRGVYGQVRDTSEKALHKAVIVVEGNSKKIVTTSRGEYWRLLVPGIYNITASARGYTDVTEEVEVPEKDPYVRQDFILRAKRKPRRFCSQPDWEKILLGTSS